MEMYWLVHLEGKDCQTGCGRKANFNFMLFIRETPRSIKLQKSRRSKDGEANSSQKKAGVTLLISDTYTLRRKVLLDLVTTCWFKSIVYQEGIIILN